MKTRIETGCFCRRLSLLLSLAVFSLVSMAGAGSAGATTTYSYSGSHTLTWTTNGSKLITVTRTGGYDSLTVNASLSGSSKFSIASSYLWWGDTTNDTGWWRDSSGYAYVSFYSSVADTNYATLILHDNTHSDTIALIGYGTDDGIDFTHSWYEDSTQRYYSNLYVNRDSGQTSTSLSETIYNHRDASIDVSIFLSDSSHWDVDGHGGSETLSLNASSDRTSGRGFSINYTPHGVYRDSVEVTVTCSSPHSQTSTFWVYVTDPLYAPVYYTPTVSRLVLGSVQPGDTACGTILIANSTSQAITITNVQNTSSNGGWNWSGLPSTPYTLNPGDSTLLTVCWSPSTYGEYGFLQLSVSYSDSSGLNGIVSNYAQGWTPGCIQGLKDSIQLDDVIEGGYVEGTATFIVHKDSLLTVGTLVGWNCTAEILSPTLPLTVHSGDTVVIHFRVTPRNDTDGWFGGEIPIMVGSCSTQVSFQGNAVDSSFRPLSLFSDQTELLALRSSTTTITKTFDFVNSSGLTERVTSVSLANGSHFSITGYDPHAPVDTLYSNDQLGISMQFDANTTGFYQDSLTIVTEAGLSTPVIHRFNVEAIREASAGVTHITTTSSVDITLSPNPSQGLVSINIGNAPHAQVEVFDLLGSKIANVPNALTGSYTWNAGNLPNGIYIVRASGMDENGSAFVISKRLVLER